MLLSDVECQEIVLAHLPLVVQLADRYRFRARRARLPWADLIQDGTVGLLEAADRYDTEYGRAFSTYAYVWVIGHLFRAVRQAERSAGLTESDPDRLPAKPRPPDLVPLFPVPALSRRSECAHHGPIRRGSVLCCMVCYQSGMDHHSAFQRSPATDPKPDRKPKPYRPARPGAPETRRQRRARLYGDKAV